MSHRDKPIQPSMNELYSNQQQMSTTAATMGFYGMTAVHQMPSMVGVPPMNMGVPTMGMPPQVNMVTTNMSQMTVSSNMPMMHMANKGMVRPVSMPGGIRNVMQPGQMGQFQSFGSSGYTTYKGVS